MKKNNPLKAIPVNNIELLQLKDDAIISEVKICRLLGTVITQLSLLKSA